MRVSIVTLVRGRQQALLNLIKGINRSKQLPSELIVVHMNESVYPLRNAAFPIVQVQFNNVHGLPLAGARNFAIRNSSCQQVIFLDVDCIPSPDLIGDYLHAFQQKDVLWSGRIRYLVEGATGQFDLWDRLKQLSVDDPIRGNLDQFAYENFWSLNFGCSKLTFDLIGGFDEDYRGYGAEDTDFAFRARERGIPFKTMDAMAYHQHHPSYDPPLNHMSDIISNALTFHDKWAVWPMMGWLEKFERMGFIAMEDNRIKLIRLPDSEELAACLKLH